MFHTCETLCCLPQMTFFVLCFDLCTVMDSKTWQLFRPQVCLQILCNSASKTAKFFLNRHPATKRRFDFFSVGLSFNLSQFLLSSRQEQDPISHGESFLQKNFKYVFACMCGFRFTICYTFMSTVVDEMRLSKCEANKVKLEHKREKRKHLRLLVNAT